HGDRDEQPDDLEFHHPHTPDRARPVVIECLTRRTDRVQSDPAKLLVPKQKFGAARTRHPESLLPRLGP
ncbi:MAG: hypothetical protein J0H65_12350, partial [Rhizobiales bacterium]|nr:hypothetical protein [Hyphomicrobiales bacterium]